MKYRTALLINIVWCIGGAFAGQTLFDQTWAIWLAGSVTGIGASAIWALVE